MHCKNYTINTREWNKCLIIWNLKMLKSYFAMIQIQCVEKQLINSELENVIITCTCKKFVRFTLIDLHIKR